MPFICSICGEPSTRICARCTKDACDNHLCDKCLRCSDCCECEVALAEPARHVVRVAASQSVQEPPLPEPALEWEPEPAPAELEREPEPAPAALEWEPEPAPAVEPPLAQPAPVAPAPEPEPEPLPE